MLTPLGKFLRKLRLDNDQLLRDMAERLDMPSSTLSAIETGRRKPPQGFAEKVGRAYALADEPLFLRIRSKRMEHRDRRLVALEGRPKYRHRLRAKVFRPG